MKENIYKPLLVLVIIGCCLITYKASAQNGSINGKVVDDQGTPVSYATVILEGTQFGANTDDDGLFEINNVPPGTYTLKVSNLGYTDFKQSVSVSSSLQTLTLTLKAAFHSLNEVVVVGYQTQKRSNITGAVSTVNAEELSKLPVGNLDQALQGKASGVRITQSTGQPGEGIAVRIRGVGTINDNNP
nr:carboxypeptidase-like regulatory domain-containing protein [Chitinophagales bacterium]